MFVCNRAHARESSIVVYVTIQTHFLTGTWSFSFSNLKNFEKNKCAIPHCPWMFPCLQCYVIAHPPSSADRDPPSSLDAAVEDSKYSWAPTPSNMLL